MPSREMRRGDASAASGASSRSASACGALRNSQRRAGAMERGQSIFPNERLLLPDAHDRAACGAFA
jgi:hypothetical protein